MRSNRPKVLHEIGGKPLIGHGLATAETLSPERIAVVVGPEMDTVANAVAPVPTAVQHNRLGTADALKAARGLLAGFERGTVFVVFGDTPFIAPATYRAMAETRSSGSDLVVLGFEPADPAAYGRLVLGADGQLDAIVEFKDADDATRAIGLCNSGVMAIDAARLWGLVDRIGNDNAKGEYYLTDIVAIARGDGLSCTVVTADEAELLGINSRAELAAAEAQWQDRARVAAMDGGATLLDPSTVYFSWDTVIGQDVTVGQNVVFGPGVEIADGAWIAPFCHLEDTVVGTGATVGPFARLRGGVQVGEGARIGSFVESKNARFGPGAKAPHLSYIGDAEIGAKANIGAGTITCNYDGVLKHKTVVGAGAFVGSNTALVAPVTIGERALIGAGSTITKDVAENAIAITRSPQKSLPNAADKRRQRLQAEKDARKAGESS